MSYKRAFGQGNVLTPGYYPMIYNFVGSWVVCHHFYYSGCDHPLIKGNADYPLNYRSVMRFEAPYVC